MQLFETKRRTPSISLAALIDILFLLIIFFVVSSRIIGESGVKLVLPYDKSKRNPLTEKQLPDALRELKKTHARGGLLMNIDRKVPHGRVVRLMNLVRESGFQHIVFGTQSSRPE